MNPMDNVMLNRSKSRPGAMSYIGNVFAGFVQLHGDRRFGDDRAILAGLANLNGRPVTVIATDKGSDAKSSAARNFGSAHPEGYRKALRLMKQAEKFHRPVVCLINTPGAYCGVGAEERGQGQAIAENLMEMLSIKTPIISVLTGEGGSGGALALAVADGVWMLERSVYSVISPEGCASILYRDVGLAATAAENLRLTAPDLLELGVIDKIILDSDYAQTYALLKEELTATFKQLMSLPPDELVALRRQKFRRMGSRP